MLIWQPDDCNLPLPTNRKTSERQPRSPCHRFLVPLSQVRPTRKEVNETALTKTKQAIDMHVFSFRISPFKN